MPRKGGAWKKILKSPCFQELKQFLRGGGAIGANVIRILPLGTLLLLQILNVSLKAWANLLGHIVGKMGLPKIKAFDYQKLSMFLKKRYSSSG